jgi:D-alanyl-D-alanine carboxypeptidase
VGAAWRIQIGAYADAAEAGRRIQAAMSRAPGVLQGKGPATVPVKTASRTLFRSRFTGFTGEDQARNACTTLIREGISCITVPPDDWYAPSAN